MRMMKKLLAGFGMNALGSAPSPRHELPVSRLDLARMGIPARKIPRILQELQRTADSSPLLQDRITMLRLARALDKVLL